MSEDTWDLVVIGTGGAAMAAGIEARSRGRQVLLIEHGSLGGTCLNVGCVPSKNLLAAAGQRHRALANRSFPMVPTSAEGVDLPALMGQKQELIDQLRQAKYADVADAHGFPVRYGHARFVDDRTLEVDGEQVLDAAYVVATDVAPHIPDLPGLDAVEYLTSTTALEQQEVADVLRGVFADDGINVVEERGEAVERTAADGVLVRTSSGLELTAQRLLVATGRFADTGGLGLGAAGVQTDERGFITVDANQRTSNPRIFAAGDVSGVPQYVSVAAQTGHVAASGALGDPAEGDYRGLPGLTFTTPQIDSAGLTEQQALAAGHDCNCRVLGAKDSPRALANRDTRGALKLVADADAGTGKVLARTPRSTAPAT